MSGTIGQRKSDHITLCATGEVGFRTMGPLFDQVRLVHDALPDLHADAIDTSLTLFGKKLRAPLVIASMTGGTEDAGRINRELASLAEERGIAFGLGSQRAMHVRKGTGSTYRVRDVAPSTVVLGNVGVVQAREMSTADVRALADEIGADALCIHLNPAMELVQPGGDRDFTRGLETIARLVRELGPDGGARPIPVVVKETGCGIGPHVAARLASVGVLHIDVSGAGGTSWVGVETERAAEQGDAKGRALGEAFWDWGIPTAACVALAAPLKLQTVIATGGVATGLDVAKAIALGATAAGIARPVLKALVSGGREKAAELLDAALAELRAAMLLTGSANLASLRRAPRVLGGDLSLWVDQLSKRER
ncbi:MAG: type 2 isopentenyl-diphosphate Delta-isomerase [Polyangiaceae bacterium]